ncbi:MAG: signal recognition particle-docking protein FtsY [SAR324 cluster bacterium]|nr:signal recognition particle-docking protein FtsY [SAR324 cluster bacterium]
MFEKILGSDPQLLAAGVAVLFFLLILILLLVRTFRSLELEEKGPSVLSEKERQKRIDKLAQEEQKQREQRSETRLNRIQEEEDRLKSEIREREAEMQEQRLLRKDLVHDEEPEEEPPSGLLEQFRQGLRKTRDQFLEGIGNTVYGKKEIDEEVLEELEEVLLSADLGPETSQRILDAITEKVERQELKNPETLKEAVRNEITGILEKQYPVVGSDKAKPLIILFVGVNGVGKTTTIGKIASQYVQEGRKVLMGAGDTFRAAAIEQLEQWAGRAGCDIVSKEAGSDPSAVMYETVAKAWEGDYDVVICDTAGRLHTKKNLMEELKKMIRVIKKQIPEAPHQVLLVLDATTGQNAIFQTREFLEAAELTGLVVTKLDSTSKGGVIIGIVNEFDIPVRYVGIGEKIRDLRPFDARDFAESLFG